MANKTNITSIITITAQIYIFILAFCIITFCCCLPRSIFVSAATIKSSSSESDDKIDDGPREEQVGVDSNSGTFEQGQRNLSDVKKDIDGKMPAGQKNKTKEENGSGSRRRRLFVAFVFGMSFRISQEFEYGTSKRWLSSAGLSYDLRQFYTGMADHYFVKDPENINFMAIFPNTNDEEQSRQCWSSDDFLQLDLDRQLEKFYVTEEARQLSDIGADVYEPERQLNSALMDRAEAIIIKCSNASWWDPMEVVKIVYITNFAEKSFARRDFSALKNKIPGIRLPIVLLAMNGATYNYHFYSIKEEDYRRSLAPIVLHLGIPAESRLIDFQKRLWGDSFCQHVIYVVALSDRLLNRHTQPVDQQYYAVNLAIKEPLERDLDSEMLTSVLLLSSCFWSRFSTDEDDEYYFLNPQWATNWYELDKTTGCLLNSRQAVIETGWYRREISRMLHIAMTMYDRVPGATLRHDRINDSVRPMLQKKRPRLVLVTDLFEENIPRHLPDERFELKVYALNLTAFERYKRMERGADFVRLLNPNSPGEIPIKKERPEPPEWNGKMGMQQWQIVLIIVGSTCAILTLALIAGQKLYGGKCRSNRQVAL